MTLKQVVEQAITSLSGAGINTYLAEHLNVDAEGQLLAPSDSEYVILHLITDPSTRDFDGEAFAAPRLQVDAYSPTISGAYDLTATAVAALVGWERQTTRSLGRDAAHVCLATDLVFTR